MLSQLLPLPLGCSQIGKSPVEEQIAYPVQFAPLLQKVRMWMV